MSTKQHTETVILRDPSKPLSDYAGLPYTFVTWDGEAIHGVTAARTLHTDAHGNVTDTLVVDLPGGKWAHARYEFIAE